MLGRYKDRSKRKWGWNEYLCDKHYQVRKTQARALVIRIQSRRFGLGKLGKKNELSAVEICAKDCVFQMGSDSSNRTIIEHHKCEREKGGVEGVSRTVHTSQA